MNSTREWHAALAYNEYSAVHFNEFALKQPICFLRNGVRFLVEKGIILQKN